MKTDIFVFFESVNQNLFMYYQVFKTRTSKKVAKNIVNKKEFKRGSSLEFTFKHWA